MQRRLLVAPLLLVSATAPLNNGTLAALGQSSAALLASALRDPVALIAGRSPGIRGNDLIQTKPSTRVAAGTGPNERVLDEVRLRPPAMPPAGIPPLAESILNSPSPLAALPSDLILGSSPPGDLLTSAGLPTGVTPLPGFGGGARPLLVESSGGSGSGGGVGGGGGSLPQTVTPTSPVPEPSTWIQMIVGFMAVGIALRRDKRRQISRV